MAEDILLAEKNPVRWTVRGKTPIFIPVDQIEEEGGNRIVERTRFDRPGAKLDDTGRKARRWTISTTISNPMKESGIPYVDPYPGLVDEIIVSFDVHETGDLYLPTVGINVRARAESYRRREESTTRNAAGLVLVFAEDNEDGVEAASFAKPAARSTAEYFSKAAQIEALYSGAYNEEVAELSEKGKKLEEEAKKPGYNLDKIEQVASEIIGYTSYIEDVFSGNISAALRGAEFELAARFSTPESDLAIRSLRDVSDLAHRAVEEAASAKPKIVPRRYTNDTSLIQVSNETGITVEELIIINPKLGNPFYIPAGRTVYVYETY